VIIKIVKVNVITLFLYNTELTYVRGYIPYGSLKRSSLLKVDRAGIEDRWCTLKECTYTERTGFMNLVVFLPLFRSN